MLVSGRHCLCLAYHSNVLQLLRLQANKVTVRYRRLSNFQSAVRYPNTMAPDEKSGIPGSSSYEDAIVTLNSLQSNSQTIAKIRQQRASDAAMNLRHSIECLTSLGITSEQLNALNVVHVSGTKGKGSTCAFVESILRHQGYKTGFYSSPHLVHARERFRINGQPIDESLFAKYFWHVYNTLNADSNITMPSYFKFLTVMGYQLFINERVDVAIIEVGIGGSYDCTNVVTEPAVCGVTLLDLDHQSTLGHTLSEIAWHKAGIFKRNSPAVTVRQRHDDEMGVLCQRATEIGTPLYLCNPLPATPGSRIDGVQLQNAALALQLCRLWLQRIKDDSTSITTAATTTDTTHTFTVDNQHFTMPILPDVQITLELRTALEACHWPGRFQIISQARTTFFIDGAHTPASIEECAKWFSLESASRCAKDQQRPYRVLVFHCTSGRSPHTLLSPIHNLSPLFDLAIFCPTLANVAIDMRSDQANVNVVADQTRSLQACAENRGVWMKLLATKQIQMNGDGEREGTQCDSGGDCKAMIQPSVADALGAIETLVNGNRCDVLVTGSLHLVGALMANIDPDLTICDK